MSQLFISFFYWLVYEIGIEEFWMCDWSWGDPVRLLRRQIKEITNQPSLSDSLHHLPLHLASISGYFPYPIREFLLLVDNVVVWLVFWAQSTTRDYIRAELVDKKDAFRGEGKHHFFKFIAWPFMFSWDTLLVHVPNIVLFSCKMFWKLVTSLVFWVRLITRDYMRTEGDFHVEICSWKDQKGRDKTVKTESETGELSGIFMEWNTVEKAIETEIDTRTE